MRPSGAQMRSPRLPRGVRMPWPTYVDAAPGWGCTVCGCLVVNRDRHDSWHERLAALLGVGIEDKPNVQAIRPAVETDRAAQL